MGMTVANQCDSKQYFSLSTIDKNRLKELGIPLTVKQLRDKARRTDPFNTLYTGDSSFQGRQRKTKIWRYEDFKEQKEVVNG